MATDSPAAAKLKKLRERTGLSVREFAELLGYKASSSYAFYEDKYKREFLPVDLIQKLTKAKSKFKEGDITEAEIWRLSGVTPLPIGGPSTKAKPTAIPANMDLVPSFEGIAEIEVIGGLGSGGEAVAEAFSTDADQEISADTVRDIWSLPPGYLAGELRVTSKRARIIEVRGDSMEPTLLSGDRVMLDLGDRSLSQEGLFGLWDGDGVAVKRLERVRPSDPAKIRLISDNPRHREVELLAEEVVIIGRVVWVARKM